MNYPKLGLPVTNPGPGCLKGKGKQQWIIKEVVLALTFISSLCFEVNQA